MEDLLYNPWTAAAATHSNSETVVWKKSTSNCDCMGVQLQRERMINEQYEADWKCLWPTLHFYNPTENP